MEIFQSLVRHPAGSSRVRDEQHLIICHWRSRLRQSQSRSIDENKTLVGWTAGLGMEVGFTPNWSAKVEYLYVDLGSRFYTVTGTDNGLQASYLRFGVNYHF